MNFSFKKIDMAGFIRIWNSDFKDAHPDSHNKSFENSTKDEWKNLFEKYLLLMHEVILDGSECGYIFLSPKKDRSAHLGYGLYEEFRGKGLSVRMCSEFLDLKIPELDKSIDHLCGTTLKYNLISQKVLQKLHFYFEKEFVEDEIEYLRFRKNILNT